MGTNLNLKVRKFLVCSTGEDVLLVDPPHSLDAAIELRDQRQAEDEIETWSIVAEIEA